MRGRGRARRRDDAEPDAAAMIQVRSVKCRRPPLGACKARPQCPTRPAASPTPRSPRARSACAAPTRSARDTRTARPRRQSHAAASLLRLRANISPVEGRGPKALDPHDPLTGKAAATCPTRAPSDDHQGAGAQVLRMRPSTPNQHHASGHLTGHPQATRGSRSARNDIGAQTQTETMADAAIRRNID